MTNLEGKFLGAVFLCCSLLFGPIVFADGPTNELRGEFVPDPLVKKSFIEFDPGPDTQTPKVLQSSENSKTSFPYFVTLKGRVLDKGISIVLNNNVLMISKDRQVSIDIPIESDKQPFQLVAIDAEGTVREYNGTILVPTFGNKPYKSDALKRFSIFSSLGVSYDTNRQTRVSDFSQADLRVKLGANYFLADEAWNGAVESYYTVYSFGSNLASTSMNILGLDMRAGRKFQVKTLPRWSLNALGGWFFLTTFASSNILGFKDAFGPQLYTTVEYQVAQRETVFLNIKYGPILNGQSLFSINNSQIGLESGYSFPLSLLNKIGFLKEVNFPPHLLRVSVDFFRLGLVVGAKQLYLNNYCTNLTYDLRF